MFCRGFGQYGFGPLGSIGFGGMFLIMGFKLLIFIGLIYIAVKLLKKYSNKSNSSLRILDEKFASGEISEEEYLKRKLILSQRN